MNTITDTFLIPIPLGKKSPPAGWTKPFTPNNHNGYRPALELLNAPEKGNLGLYHLPSNTLAFDIDDFKATEELLSNYCSITLPDWLKKPKRCEIKSPKKNRGKLLFKLPENHGFKLSILKINGDMIFELRCGNCQDVIKGKHPDGGAYELIGSLDSIPPAPTILIEMLTHWSAWKSIFLNEDLPIIESPNKQATLEGSRSPITEFSQSRRVSGVLLANGYKQVAERRFIRPNSSSKSAGVIVLNNCKDGVERLFSFGGDDLNDGYAHDAFDCYRILECGGDWSKALNWNDEITKHNQRLFKTNNKQATVEDSDAITIPYPKKFKLYGIGGAVAELASRDSEADPLGVYISFLTAMGALIGEKTFLRVGETRHNPRIFCALVGNSSRARKGTSLKPVERIIKTAQDMSKYSQRLKWADGGLSSAEGLIYAVRDPTYKDDEIDDEGVVDKRLLVVEEELGNVLKVAQREGNTLSPVLRRAWDGGTLAPMTKNNQLCATRPHISTIGHITRAELSILMSESDLHNGLANRFLWACVNRPKKLAFPLPMPRCEVEEICQKLARVIDDSLGDERELTLSLQARKFWTDAYGKISTDSTSLRATVTARSEAYCLRLASLVCVLDGEVVIEQKHLEAGIDLVGYCNQSAAYIFTSPDDSDNADTKKLLDAIPKNGLSQTGVSKLFYGHKSKDELRKLLDELQSSGKIEQQKASYSKKIMWFKKIS